MTSPANKKPKILIVEDEESIREGLTDVLIYHQYEVDSAEEGKSGLSKAISGIYDLILLDVMLPNINGFEICSQVREKDRHQPIIMLTAKSENTDIVSGLHLGADDYITKPFSIEQLIARIEAVLRRSNAGFSKDVEIRLSDKTFINLETFEGETDGKKVSYTQKEIELLSYLYKNNNRPVSREELLAKVWGYSKKLNIETRSVDIHIAKIRKKLEQNSTEPKHLVTIRGTGYRLILSN